MRSTIVRRSVRAWAGASFALLACVLLAPSKSQAGCSHGVIVGSGQKGLDPLLDPLILGQPAAEPSPGSVPTDPRPCSGPSCSGRPAVPPAPAAAVVRFVEPWACLAVFPPLAEPGPGRYATGSDTLRPIHSPSAIFHPPRPV
jgi:hypothetical protein